MTGKVAFYQTSDNTNRIDIVPDKTGFYKTSDHSFRLEPTLDPNSIAWHTGRLIFKNTPLSDAFKIIAECFGKDLIIEPDAPVNYYISYEFDKESLNEILKDIDTIIPASVKLNVITTENRIIVKKH